MKEDEKKEAHSRVFDSISKDIMQCYQEKLHDFLNSQEIGSITDADVVIMIMNLTIGVATNMYYSIKQILPTTPVDYEFARVKIINVLVDQFEKIKQYTPDNVMMPLTTDQVKEIYDKGEINITLPDGKIRRVTKEDIMVKKEEVEKLLESKKTEILGTNPPKIILPPSRTH